MYASYAIITIMYRRENPERLCQVLKSVHCKFKRVLGIPKKLFWGQFERPFLDRFDSFELYYRFGIFGISIILLWVLTNKSRYSQTANIEMGGGGRGGTCLENS